MCIRDSSWTGSAASSDAARRRPARGPSGAAAEEGEERADGEVHAAAEPVPEPDDGPARGAAEREHEEEPPSISVPAGTSFTVNWINATGCTEIDIDKDGTVPIVIGLEPGASHHDTVREWCGSLFTGTF